jgi:hypothetical protein
MESFALVFEKVRPPVLLKCLRTQKQYILTEWRINGLYAPREGIMPFEER